MKMLVLALVVLALGGHTAHAANPSDLALVPEPTGLLLMGIGLLGAATFVRRRR